MRERSFKIPVGAYKVRCSHVNSGCKRVWNNRTYSWSHGWRAVETTEKEWRIKHCQYDTKVGAQFKWFPFLLLSLSFILPTHLKAMERVVSVHIRNRFNEYQQKTEPLLQYYEQQGKLVRVHGMGSIDEIFNNLSEAIDRAQSAA